MKYSFAHQEDFRFHANLSRSGVNEEHMPFMVLINPITTYVLHKIK